jgi:CheY-like chemotaxis protein
MPKKDGREALKEIKSDPNFRLIPVVVFTTSQAERDILKSYHLGANSFVTKPTSFQGLLEATNAIITYWFKTVKLPET